MSVMARPETRLLVDAGHVDAARSVTAHGDARLVLRDADGSERELPANLQRLLFSAMRTLAAGGAVSLGSLPEELTTTVAADILGISRPTLMKWIAEEKVAAHKVGTHTRLRRDDVLALRQTRHEERRKALQALMDAEADLEG